MTYVIINGSVKVLNYYKSLKDIKEGENFGLVTTKSQMRVIHPDMECVWDNNTGRMNIQMKDTFLFLLRHNEEAKKLFKLDGSPLFDNDPIPLIFKKKKGNIAQEYFTGLDFIISEPYDVTHDYCMKNLSTKQFQNAIDKYGKTNIVIQGPLSEFTQATDDDEKSFIKITDDYMNLVRSDSSKLLTIDMLRDLKQQGQEYFKIKLKECVDMLHAQALFENEIYNKANEGIAKNKTK